MKQNNEKLFQTALYHDVLPAKMNFGALSPMPLKKTTIYISSLPKYLDNK